MATVTKFEDDVNKKFQKRNVSAKSEMKPDPAFRFSFLIAALLLTSRSGATG
ncbi:hypothetical protein TRIP_B330529 [uncultured Desulfatiglans sp.]|nr:hypothetical protein TRIP_B330529 [uncultured Desulfatiglans sp.]